MTSALPRSDNELATLRATRDQALTESDWYLAAAAAEATALTPFIDETLTALPPEAEIPRLRLGLARVRLMAATSPDEALEAAGALDRVGANLADRLADPAVRVPTLELLLEVAALAGHDSAVAQLAEALRAQALSAGLLENAVGAETLRAEALLRLDSPAAALEAARLAHGHGLRLDDQRWAARAAEARGIAARRLGRALEAAESFDSALASSRVCTGLPPDTTLRLQALRAAAHLSLGANPLPYLRELEALATSDSPDARSIALGAITTATATALPHDQLAAARAALEASEPDQALALVADRTDARALLIRAEALARTGDPVMAVAAADAALQASRGLEPIDEARARIARSRHLLTLGDRDGARADARVASTLAREIENPALMASAALELGRGLLAGENIEAALEAMTEAALACARMGSFHHALELAVRRALTTLEWSEANVAHPELDALFASALEDTTLPPASAARVALAWAASAMSDGRFAEARTRLAHASTLDLARNLGLGADVDKLDLELTRREGERA